MQVPAEPNAPPPVEPSPPRKATATQFFLKGLAISLPPVLTLVILAWMAQLVYGYVVRPITTSVRFVIATVVDESRPTADFARPIGLPPLEYCGNDYRVPRSMLADLRSEIAARTDVRDQTIADLSSKIGEAAYVPFGEWSVPYRDFAQVASRMRPNDIPASVRGLYMELATIRYFTSLGSLSAIAIALSIVGLYFLGRFVTARMGQWMLTRFESLVLARLPIINNVYASVKQVTDFIFSERTIAYNRVVGIEYPRRGSWTIGFATNESVMELTLAAGEPLISVMIPAAPIPMTGSVLSVPKSAVIDLNMTIDQAFQYCLSCGVLVPEHQRATPELLQRELAKRLSHSFQAGTFPGLPAGAPPRGDDGESRPWAPESRPVT